MPITWQSFRAIGRLISEKAWRKNKTSAVKHKPVRNYRSGRPKKNDEALVTSSFFFNFPLLKYTGEESSLCGKSSKKVYVVYLRMQSQKLKLYCTCLYSRENLHHQLYSKITASPCDVTAAVCSTKRYTAVKAHASRRLIN